MVGRGPAGGLTEDETNHRVRVLRSPEPLGSGKLQLSDPCWYSLGSFTVPPAAAMITLVAHLPELRATYAPQSTTLWRTLPVVTHGVHPSGDNFIVMRKVTLLGMLRAFVLGRGEGDRVMVAYAGARIGLPESVFEVLWHVTTRRGSRLCASFTILAALLLGLSLAARSAAFKSGSGRVAKVWID